MNVTTLGRSLPGAALRRWRGLRWRTRAVLALLTVAASGLTILMIRRPGDEWPARVVLETTRESWPLGFSPDGRAFLTSKTGSITLWDTTTGRPGKAWPLRREVSARMGAYSPDGRTFAAAIIYVSSIRIELIDATTGQSRATLDYDQSGIYQLAFEPDGKTLRAFLSDNRRNIMEVVTCDALTGREIRRHPITAPINLGPWAISPDGRTLAFIRIGTTFVQLWDVELDRQLPSLINPNGGEPYGRGPGISEDGKTLTVERYNGEIELWDLPTRTLRNSFFLRHSSPYATNDLKFSPNGRTLASTVIESSNVSSSVIGQLIIDLKRKFLGMPQDPQLEVVVTDIATGDPIARAPSSIPPMYSPDGKTVATRQGDGSIQLRDLPKSPK